MLLVLFMVLSTLLSIIIGLGWNPSKTLGWRQFIAIQLHGKPFKALKSHVVPYPRLDSIPFCLISLLLFFSSSSSSSSSLLFPLHVLFFPQNMRPILVFKSPYLLGLVWPSKTHFWVNFLYLLFGPPTLDHLYFKFPLFHFGLKSC